MNENLISELPEDIFERYPDLSLEERRDGLISIADSYGEEEYMRHFTEEEKQRFKEDLASVSIDLHSKEEELKVITASLRDEMKPLKDQKKRILKNLSSGQEWTTDVVYRVAVPEKGVIGVYDKYGRLQKIEKMKNGLQKMIPLRTGTDD